MPAPTTSPSAYNLGFTAFGLGEAHAHALATLYLGLGDWERTKEAALRENTFRQTKSTSSHRLEREFRLRLQTLTARQLHLLVEDPATAKVPLALLAVFKRYRFIRDFVEDALAEKYAIHDFDVRPSDYSSFVEHAEAAHPELLGLSDTSAKKIRQVTLRILTEGGILSDSAPPRIAPSFLPEDVADAITAEDPALLRPFLQPGA